MAKTKKRRSWVEFKLLPFFCNHDFIIGATRVLYCTRCGKVKTLPCSHKWKTENISYEGGVRGDDGKIKQWQVRWHHLVCEICGNHKRVAA